MLYEISVSVISFLFYCLKLNNFTLFLARTSGYAIAGDGHCDDWVYLPEGGYPETLAESNPLYNVDRIQECKNRCVNAADKGLNGSNSHGDPKIRDLAFYIRLSDQHCACSSGACSKLTPDPAFRSYYTVTGKSQTYFLFSVQPYYLE